jgi:hypothetical protein
VWVTWQSVPWGQGRARMAPGQRLKGQHRQPAVWRARVQHLPVFGTNKALLAEATCLQAIPTLTRRYTSAWPRALPLPLPEITKLLAA